MSIVAGLSIAYMKILSLAAVIVAVVWVAAKVSLALHQKKAGRTRDHGDAGVKGADSDGATD